MGYEYICPYLPSLGPNSSGVTYLADVEAIQKIAVDLFEQGKEVVLIGHSAGGIPAVSRSLIKYSAMCMGWIDAPRGCQDAEGSGRAARLASRGGMMLLTF